MTAPPPPPAVPPLPAEDHVCAACGVDYAALPVEAARATVAGVPARVRAAALAVPEPAVRRRPDPGTWSVVEYVCHLRDVYTSSTIRLHRTRTEDRPVLEPMLNDLRARRFRYAERDLRPMLDELAATVAGFLDETRRVAGPDWDRTATRLPGEHRTARWLVRHAAHEGVHHLRDIAAVARAVSRG